MKGREAGGGGGGRGNRGGGKEVTRTVQAANAASSLESLPLPQLAANTVASVLLTVCCEHLYFPHGLGL